jgi:hypothetical protein
MSSPTTSSGWRASSAKRRCSRRSAIRTRSHLRQVRHGIPRPVLVPRCSWTVLHDRWPDRIASRRSSPDGRAAAPRPPNRPRQLEAAHEHDIVHRDLKPPTSKPEAPIGGGPPSKGLVVRPGQADRGRTRAGVADSSPRPRAGLPPRKKGVNPWGRAALHEAPSRQQLDWPVDRPRNGPVVVSDACCTKWITGRQAFGDGRDSLSDAVATMLKSSNVDWSGAPGDHPRSIRRLLRRCVKKARHERCRARAGRGPGG